MIFTVASVLSFAQNPIVYTLQQVNVRMRPSAKRKRTTYSKFGSETHLTAKW